MSPLFSPARAAALVAAWSLLLFLPGHDGRAGPGDDPFAANSPAPRAKTAARSSGGVDAQILIRTHVVRAPGGTTIEKIAPVLQDAQPGQVVILAREQGEALLESWKKRIRWGRLELLAAPQVVARSGQRCKVEMIQELIYPIEYDPPEIPQGAGSLEKLQQSGGVFPVTPANPTAFETREVGIAAEFHPAFSPKQTILLAMALERVRFCGFINYGTPITTGVKSKSGKIKEVVLTENRILQPVFSTQRTTSEVEIEDGQFILVGGTAESKQAIQGLEGGHPPGFEPALPEFDDEGDGIIYFLIQAARVKPPRSRAE